MPMKRFCPIFLATLLAVWFCACAKTDDTLSTQQKQIVDFLTSKHNPPLVPEQDLVEGANQGFYVQLGDGLYRYIDIGTYYNPLRPTWPEVTTNSVVTITFSSYVFENKIIDNNDLQVLPFLSNDPFWKAALTDPATGEPTVVWPFEPLVIDMQSPNIIKGLELALIGCRQGDQVEAYMSYNMAYGDGYFSVIPKQSPVAVFFTVDSVE